MTPVAVVENVTPQCFREEIAPAGRPVLMKNLVADWPVIAAGRRSPRSAVDYVKRFDAGRPIETIFAEAHVRGAFFYDDELRGLNFFRRPARLAVSLEGLMAELEAPEPRSIYIQSAPIPENLPGFERENRLDLLDSDIEPRIWIGNRLVVQTHFDLSSNIACVAAGRRRFTLFPPHQLPNLYVGPFELTLAGPPVSMVRLEAPDFERYPRFREALAEAETATLEPGDALFIPYFWWHHVQSLDAFNILVNYWWSDADASLASPFDAMLHAILSVRDLPPAQRAIWREVFDYYVFGSHGDPVAHLPEPARGALGPHSPELRRQLWATLAKAVGRHAARLHAPGGGRPPSR